MALIEINHKVHARLLDQPMIADLFGGHGPMQAESIRSPSKKTDSRPQGKPPQYPSGIRPPCRTRAERGKPLLSYSNLGAKAPFPSVMLVT